MRTAISCKFLVSIPRDLSPGSENGLVSIVWTFLILFFGTKSGGTIEHILCGKVEVLGVGGLSDFVVGVC